MPDSWLIVSPSTRLLLPTNYEEVLTVFSWVLEEIIDLVNIAD